MSIFRMPVLHRGTGPYRESETCRAYEYVSVSNSYKFCELRITDSSCGWEVILP